MNKEKHINTNKQKRIYMRDSIPRKQQTLRGELKKEEKMRAGLHMSKKAVPLQRQMIIDTFGHIQKAL